MKKFGIVREKRCVNALMGLYILTEATYVDNLKHGLCINYTGDNNEAEAFRMKHVVKVEIWEADFSKKESKLVSFYKFELGLVQPENNFKLLETDENFAAGPISDLRIQDFIVPFEDRYE